MHSYDGCPFLVTDPVVRMNDHLQLGLPDTELGEELVLCA